MKIVNPCLINPEQATVFLQAEELDAPASGLTLEILERQKQDLVDSIKSEGYREQFELLFTQLYGEKWSTIELAFVEWGMGHDYISLYHKENFTNEGVSDDGIGFREFAANIVDHLNLREQVEKLVEEFYNENIALNTGVTFIEPEVINYLRQINNQEPTDEEVSKQGIRFATELVILLTITDIHKAFTQDDLEQQKEHWSKGVQERNARFVMRVLNKWYPDEFNFDINTKSWSIPYHWTHKILQLLQTIE